LEASLRTNGLLQPVAVRPRGDGSYELIAGERRLRAATRLGWERIPALVRPLDDRDMLVLALVENLQRADLNPLDEALGYQRLMQEFALTQLQVADAVGKDRSTVANLLRILALPEGIRKMVRDDTISLGHARALLSMPNERAMLDAARQVVERHLSVRDLERMAQALRPAATRPTSPRSSEGRPAAQSAADTAEVRRLTELLRRRLQTDVRIDLQSDSKGAVFVSFYSSDDLLRIVEVMLGRPADQH
jgi:ParB family chromosome partitioning protein